MTANCSLAFAHSLGGMVHSFSARFKTRQGNLVAASSFRKWHRCVDGTAQFGVQRLGGIRRVRGANKLGVQAVSLRSFPWLPRLKDADNLENLFRLDDCKRDLGSHFFDMRRGS
jgi:hypothetical protein